MKKVSKKLTLTDVGKNNSHLSAIRIPASVVGSEVLPELSKEELNPKLDLVFYDENGKGWVFQYIYYNDKYHGKPSRCRIMNIVFREYVIILGHMHWRKRTKYGFL